MSLLWVQAAGWAYKPHPREALPVEELPAHEFVKKFKPGCYADTWESVDKDPDYHELGDDGWDLDDLGHSLREHGMHHPVEVDSSGEVSDGHHRVMKALEHGVPVRYQHWT